MSPRRTAGRLAGLLGLVVLLAPLLVLVAGPAQACSCLITSPEQQGELADVVAVAEVRDVAEQPGTVAERVTLLVDVERVYKGIVPSRTLAFETSADDATCGLGALDAGERWVFYLAGDGRGLTAGSCGGSSVATSAATADVEEVFGRGEAAGQVADDAGGDPAPPELTLVGERAAPDPIRLAAPGGVLVGLGLLGLLVLLPFRGRR